MAKHGITSINSGTVFQDGAKGWTYTIIVNGGERPVGDAYFRSAGDAKQAMRENVTYLRNQYGL